MTTDYERKAIEQCVRPVQMAIDALSKPDRKDEDEQPTDTTKHIERRDGR